MSYKMFEALMEGPRRAIGGSGGSDGSAHSRKLERAKAKAVFTLDDRNEVARFAQRELVSGCACTWRLAASMHQAALYVHMRTKAGMPKYLILAFWTLLLSASHWPPSARSPCTIVRMLMLGFCGRRANPASGQRRCCGIAARAPGLVWTPLGKTSSSADRLAAQETAVAPPRRCCVGHSAALERRSNRHLSSLCQTSIGGAHRYSPSPAVQRLSSRCVLVDLFSREGRATEHNGCRVGVVVNVGQIFIP